MEYQLSNLNKRNVSLNKNQFLSIIGLYFFVLGTAILGFSIYLFLEAIGYTSQMFINWSGQGLFWSLITFFVALFILFIPVEFFDTYSINNRSFKDLLSNIVSVIMISMVLLVLFQLLLSGKNIFLNQYLVIVRAVSFSGFISIPLVLFLAHNFGKNIDFINKYSYSLVLLVWTISTQIFL